MINIEATTLDLRVGDVWDGKEIVAIASPPVKDGTVWLYFAGEALPTSFSLSAVFLVKRAIENVLTD